MKLKLKQEQKIRASWKEPAEFEMIALKNQIMMLHPSLSHVEWKKVVNWSTTFLINIKREN